MELFDEDDKVQVIQDKKTLQAEVLSSRRAVLLGAFSDDPQECEGCSAVSKEFKKAAETLAGYGVLSVSCCLREFFCFVCQMGSLLIEGLSYHLTRPFYLPRCAA
jgi:hypothetical protein